MERQFRAVSLSHKLAPVDIRELIYLPESVCTSLLTKMSEILGIREALIFSTCNRTEVYYVSDRDLSHEIIKILGIEKGIQDPLQYERYFSIMNDEKVAIQYLFEVSMGLESKVLGDLQIANQIKKAYVWSNDIGMAGAFLHRLLHTIFHANKRVHQETPYRDGAASASYAATEIAAELTTHLARPRALVLGLGEMGKDVARNLNPDLFHTIHLANRTHSKAQELANEIGVMAIPLENVLRRVEEYDVIISSVSVEEPLIRPDWFEVDTLRSKFVIDLCVPRSVAREVETLPHVIVYNIDDIQGRTTQVLDRRRAAIPQVKNIIREEIAGFLAWRQELNISPIIHKIKDSLEQVRQEELARFMKRANDKEAKLLQNFSQSMINKVLKLQVLNLKEACRRDDKESLLDVINDLFDVEASRKKTK